MAAKIGKGFLQAAFSSSVSAQLSDGDLLSRFASGDQTAFETLVNRHTGLVLGICRRMLPTLQDAEDACQATFLVLARKVKTTRWQSSVANWLFTTARRVASRANRALARRLRREADGAASGSISVLDQMTGREVLAALDEELDKLPSILREPLILCYLQGLTRDEAAFRLGVRSTTLKCQLERGRKKLAAALTKRGIDIGAALMAVATISSARASSSRMIQSILATVDGSPAASVTALANGLTVTGIAMKTKLLVLAVVGLIVLGFELASMQTKAGLQEQLIASSMRPVTNADAKSDELKAVQPIVKAKEQPIDQATITAFENLRGVYGGIEVTDSGHLWFSPGNDAAAKSMPSFNLVSLPGSKLSNLPRVQVPFGLDLYNVQVTDEELKQLKGLNNLTALILDGPNAQFTDAGLKELKELKSLTMLRMGGSKVTDEGLKELTNLENLTSLTLLGTHVTEVGLKELKSFKKLTTLALGGVGGEGVTDEGLKELAELKGLTALALGATKVTDAGLKELKELKNLKTLYLCSTIVTDEGLKELKSLKSLTTLYLGKARVTDEGLKELKNLTNLKSLELGGTLVENVSDLKDLKGCGLFEVPNHAAFASTFTLGKS